MKSSPEVPRAIILVRTITKSPTVHGKNLCVHGDDAKRLLAYSPNTPRDIKVCISLLIIIQI